VPVAIEYYKTAKAQYETVSHSHWGVSAANPCRNNCGQLALMEKDPEAVWNGRLPSNILLGFSHCRLTAGLTPFVPMLQEYRKIISEQENLNSWKG
jgi:hypothetical protein